MASLEQRIENLFPRRKSKKTSPAAMVALIFAERRGEWLTHEDAIHLGKEKLADSTIRKAFKELSRSLVVLGGHSFIDTESVKRDGRGCPIIRGRLSRAADEKIFATVYPVNQKPASYFIGLNGIGRLEIPPLSLVDKYLPPRDLIRIRKQKSGQNETNHLLRALTNDKPGAEKDAMLKKIETLAEKQGITFNATDGLFIKEGQIVIPTAKLAEEHFKWRRLPDGDNPYSREVGNVELFNTHKIGRFPKHQYIIMDAGLEKFATDENRIAYSTSVDVLDSRQDDERVLAIEERAKKGEKEAFDELIQVLLSDESKYARQDAANSVGHLHDERAIEPLTEAMLSDQYTRRSISCSHCARRV